MQVEGLGPHTVGTQQMSPIMSLCWLRNLKVTYQSVITSQSCSPGVFRTIMAMSTISQALPWHCGLIHTVVGRLIVLARLWLLMLLSDENLEALRGCVWGGKVSHSCFRGPSDWNQDGQGGWGIPG